MPTSTGGSSSGAGDPGAAIRVGVQLQLRGDHDGARKVFQEALDSDDPDHAPEAGLHLAGLLGKDGDLPGAAKVYERAITSNHPDHAPRAAVELAELLVRLKLDAEAKPLFEFALASAHHDNSPRAALQLGRLLERTGDATGAQQSYQHAVDSGHPYLAPPAAMRLGALLRSAGDSTAARHAFQLVLDSQHPDLADEAAAQLRELPPEEQPPEEQPSPPPEAARPVAAAEAHAAACVPTISSAPPQATGTPDERERVWRELDEGIAARNVESVEAATRYGQLLLRQDDPAGARRAYRLAAESGHWEHGPAAALQLGQLLIDSGDSDGASKAYQSALDSNHPDHAPSAAVRLGVLLTDKGDPDGARRAYEQAIGSAHPDYGPDALCHLGTVLARNGDIAGARPAYEQAIESGHPHHSPRAMVELGKALSASGDSAGACAAFERAISTGHPEHAPSAALGLGVLLESALDSGHPVHAPAAAEYLRIDSPEPTAATAAGEPLVPVLMSSEEGINHELSMARQNEDPVLPVLQPLDWADTLGGNGADGVRLLDSMARPLMLAGRHIGYVAFGRDSPTTIQLESPGQLTAEGRIPAEYEAAALMNLRSLGLSWGDLELAPDDIEAFGVLACTGHPLAASAVLDRSFLAQAELILGCDRLVVAIPNQDLLLVARADLPPGQLADFANAVCAFHISNQRPVTPLTFYATGGVVDSQRDPGPSGNARPGVIVRAEDTPVPRPAHQPAMASGNSGHSSAPALRTGHELREQGDYPNAEVHYRRVLDSGQAEHGAEAHHGLGLVRIAMSDLPGARDYLQQAVNAGHAEISPTAALALGRVLGALGDVDGGRRAFQLAADSGHHEAAPAGAVLLGQVWGMQGNLAKAQEAFQRAIDFGPSDSAQEAMVYLAQCLHETGDIQGACRALGQLIDPDRPLYAQAAWTLGSMLCQLQDIDGARAAFRRAAESGDPEWTARAAEAMQRLTEHDRAGSRSSGHQGGAGSGVGSARTEVPWSQLAKAVAAGDRAAIEAAVALGKRLAREGKRAEAERAYRLVIESHYPVHAPVAAQDLSLLTGADVLALVDGPDGLERVLVTTVDGSDDVDHLEELEKLEAAVEAGEAGSVEAMMELGNSFVEQMDFDSAMRAYETVVRSRHPRLAAEAGENLRLVRIAFGSN